MGCTNIKKNMGPRTGYKNHTVYSSTCCGILLASHLNNKSSGRSLTFAWSRFTGTRPWTRSLIKALTPRWCLISQHVTLVIGCLGVYWCLYCCWDEGVVKSDWWDWVYLDGLLKDVDPLWLWVPWDDNGDLLCEWKGHAFLLATLIVTTGTKEPSSFRTVARRATTTLLSLSLPSTASTMVGDLTAVAGAMVTCSGTLSAPHI